LMKNKFEKVTIFDVNVDVEITSGFEVAEIVSAKMPNKKVKPGDIIPITIEFKPYRAANFTKQIEFKVPDNQKAGSMNIVVRSGNAYVWLTKLIKKQKEEGTVAPNEEKKLQFKEFLQDFNEADRNNEIIVDILPSVRKKTSEKTTDSGAQNPAVTGFRTIIKGSKYKQKYPLDFIANGEVELTVSVGTK